MGEAKKPSHATVPLSSSRRYVSEHCEQEPEALKFK